MLVFLDYVCIFFILMIICLQDSRVTLSSSAGLPVPGHANDAMTVSTDIILINSEGEQNRVNVFKNKNVQKF